MVMRRLLIISAVLWAGVVLVKAQSPSELIPEKAKMQLQLQDAKQLQTVDPAKAIRMLSKVAQNSKRSGWSDLRYESSTLLAKLYKVDESYRKAGKAAKDALETAKILKDNNKTLASLENLKGIYEMDGRSRRLNEVNEEYTRLKTAMDLQARNQEYARLENNYAEATAEMQEMMESLTQAEIIQRLLKAEADELAWKNLEAELQLEKEASKVLALNAKNRAQKARLVRISLVTVFGTILAAVWVWIARNKRKQDAVQALLKQQLLQKDKMATLGEMTAGVAHEIKNPLNFVNNFAEGSIDMLEDLQETLQGHLPEIPDDDREDVTFLLGELQQNAKDIFEQGKRADTIINGMMNHARGESTESSLANINDLLLDSWDLARAGASLKYPDLKVKLQKEIATDLPDIRVIPQDLNRVFLNIFNNSLEAFAERDTANPQISIQTAVEDNQVRIRIMDNAGGIPKEIQEKVFNPFFTTKPTGKGNTGLGLSIAHDIIEKGHDGDIRLKSDAEQQTEITIRLPKMTR